MYPFLIYARVKSIRIDFFNKVKIELLPIKMFEINKNYIYDDIFNAKPYLTFSCSTAIF